MVLVYNKMLLSEALRPDTLAGLAEAAVKHPEKFKGKIGTYTVKNAFGRSVNWAYVRERGDAAWRTLERLGTATKRSEEHTSELQSLMRISYAVFCLTNTTTQLFHNTN